MRFVDRMKNGWNAFLGRNPTEEYNTSLGNSYGSRPDRFLFTRGNERSLVTTVLNKIAVDCALVDIKHVRCDEEGRYLEDIKTSSLYECLTLEANMDQTGRSFIQDVVMTLLDDGCVAIVPTDGDRSYNNDSLDIYALRTGKILTWSPEYIKADVYNERLGRKENLIVPKKNAAIIENPFYAIMNQPNSTGQRLARKLALLDKTDEHNTSGKMDLIVQLPFSIKNDLKREQAEKRRKDVEMQLSSSQYGIAYIDSTEKITQLDRSIESQIQKEIEYLTDEYLAQLGITKEILNGTATEEVMLNYQSRIIEPIMSAIADEMRRKFLTQTARTQGQNIMCFKSPFKLTPVNDIAEMADKFTRNEIMTSNEIRQAIGMVPSDDPRADELRNSNLSESNADAEARLNGEYDYEDEMAQSAFNVLNNYLEHHGILGQKWGKLNGPPYPLGSGDHSSLEKKLNQAKGWFKQNTKLKHEKHHSSKYNEEKQDDKLPSEFLNDEEKQNVINELNKAGKQTKDRVIEDSTRTIREIKGDWNSSDEEIRKKYAKDYKDQLIDTAYDELDYKTNKKTESPKKQTLLPKYEKEKLYKRIENDYKTSIISWIKEDFPAETRNMSDADIMNTENYDYYLNQVKADKDVINQYLK